MLNQNALHLFRRLAYWPVLVFWMLSFPAAAGASVSWVWSGAVTPNSAVVKAKVAPHTTRVRLYVEAEGGSSQGFWPGSGEAAPDANGIVGFRLEGLAPGTEYLYFVELGGKKAANGRFRTLVDGPMSFRVAAGSCASTGSNHRIFSVIREMNPALFLHMGDFHYENIDVNDPVRFREAFDRVLQAPRQAELYRSVPVAYVWDDHDFGANNASGLSPSKPAALATYQQIVPHYPLSTVEGKVRSIQQAFTVGRVRFVITDGRSERTPGEERDGPDKTMLGKAQLEWFKQEMISSAREFPLIVWVNVVPWITRDKRKVGDGWEAYARERRELADFFQELEIVSKMVVVSGDAHMVAMDDGTNSNYATNPKPGERGFPVIQAAPLDRYPSVKGGPYSKGIATATNVLWLKKKQQFVLMEVHDDGKVLTVDFQGYDGKGRQLEGMSLTMACKGSQCEVD